MLSKVLNDIFIAHEHARVGRLGQIGRGRRVLRYSEDAGVWEPLDWASSYYITVHSTPRLVETYSSYLPTVSTRGWYPGILLG